MAWGPIRQPAYPAGSPTRQIGGRPSPRSGGPRCRRSIVSDLAGGGRSLHDVLGRRLDRCVLWKHEAVLEVDLGENLKGLGRLLRDLFPQGLPGRTAHTEKSGVGSIVARGLARPVPPEASLTRSAPVSRFQLMKPIALLVHRRRWRPSCEWPQLWHSPRRAPRRRSAGRRIAARPRAPHRISPSKMLWARTRCPCRMAGSRFSCSLRCRRHAESVRGSYVNEWHRRYKATASRSWYPSLGSSLCS